MTILGVTASSILKSKAAFESIATATGNGSATSLSFTNISSGYRHLHIRFRTRSAENGSGLVNLVMTMNSDTSNAYASHGIRATANTMSYRGATGVANMEVGVTPQSNVSANFLGVGYIDILEYAVTDKTKVMRAISGFNNNGGVNSITQYYSGMRDNTAAITSLTFTLSSAGAFTTTSEIALYGIKGS